MAAFKNFTEKNKFLIFYWLIIILLAFLFHWRHYVNSDEGMVLTGGWRVSLGQIPYLDFFDYITPGAYYYLAIFFKFFGATYLVAKIASVLLLIISAVGIFSICRLLIKRLSLCLTGPLLWLVASTFYPLINHNQYSTFAAIWAFYFFLKAFQTNNIKYYAASGFLSGITFWFLQVRGAALIITMTLLILIYGSKKIQNILLYYLSLLISLLPFLFWPINILWSNLIIFPFIYYLPGNKVSYFFIFYALAILGIIFPVIWKSGQKELWCLWWLQLFFLISVFHRSDYYHIIIQSWPLIILFFCFWESKKLKKISKFFFLMVLGHIYIVATVPFIYNLSFYFLNLSHTKPNDWLMLKNKELNEITSYIDQNTKPNEPIYAGPFIPNFYFESQRQNPTRHNLLFTNQHPLIFFLEATADLKQKKPPILILNYGMVAKFNYNRNNPVDNFIKEYYEMDKELYGLQIFKLKQ